MRLVASNGRAAKPETETYVIIVHIRFLTETLLRLFAQIVECNTLLRCSTGRLLKIRGILPSNNRDDNDRNKESYASSGTAESLVCDTSKSNSRSTIKQLNSFE